MQGVQFVQCDGSAEDQALCRDLNISATPTTLVGMEVYQGALDRTDLHHALTVPALVAQHLADAGAVLYGTSWCGWTTRQRAIFGPHADTVPYVQCDAGPAQEAKCDAAGVNGYPAWNIGGAMLPGYMSLSRLAKVSRMPGVEVVDAAE